MGLFSRFFHRNKPTIDKNQIKDTHIFIEIPWVDESIIPDDIIINVPNEFIDFADKELKLNGNLNSFVMPR